MTPWFEKILARSTWVELLGFTLSIILLVYMKFEQHECWKDEWQAWFVARDKNIIDIFSFLNYEGHPALWYLYLKPFTWLSQILPFPEEQLLSAAHLLPAIAVMFLFWQKFSYPTLLKVFFGFSYFLIFEYGVVNRGYILVILFLFAAVYFYKKDEVKGLAWSLLLLCQTEVFGVFMAIALGVYLYVENKNKYRMAWLYTTIGLFIFILCVFPRESGHIAKTQGKILSFGDRILTSIQGNLGNAFLPGTTQDTSLFGWSSLGLMLTGVLLVGFPYYFRKHKKIALPFFLALLMSVGFSLFFFVGGIRQWGMLFVFLIALLHLADLSFFKNPGLVVFLLSIGVVQSIYGFKALYADTITPFTNARAAGLFIRDKIPPKVPIVAINKFEITPVIGYARRNFYELPSGEPFSYFKWVEKIYIPTQEELRLFAKFKNVGGIVIISPKKLDPGRFSDAVLGKEFTAKNIKNENYFLYTLAVK